MRIREARVRDAEAITSIIPAEEGMAINTVMTLLQNSETPIYVATDFSANILGCSFSADKIFVSPTCPDAGVASELKSKY